MTIRFGVCAAALVGLTACGGGGVGNLGSPDLSQGAVEFDVLNSAVDFLVTYRESDPTINALSGQGVTYDGVILLAEDLDELSVNLSDEGYLGQVRLVANFDVTSGLDMTGTADNFYKTSLIDGNPDETSTPDGVEGELKLTAVERDNAFFELGLSTVEKIDGVYVVSGSFDDPDSGFKLPDAPALWVRTKSQLTVIDAADWDAVIAAD